MKFARLLLLAISLAVGGAAFAQSDSFDADIPIEYLRPKNHIFSFGYHRLNVRPKASFGNLGTVPQMRTGNGVGTGTQVAAGTIRIYDNGYVAADSATRRAGTVADENASTSLATGTGRYGTYTDAAHTPANQTGDYVSYTSGQTRYWSYDDLASQAFDSGGDVFIAMSNYSTTTTGGTAEAAGGGGAGIGLKVERTMRKLSKNWEWGVRLSLGYANLDAKTSGTVVSNLFTQTDTYALRTPTGDPVAGPAATNAPASPYVAPSFTDYTNPITSVVTTGGNETTGPLSDTPNSTTGPTPVPSGLADVNGTWQVKGAYYLFEFGPTLRAHFNDRWALSLSAGLAGAYIGTTYSADEIVVLPNVVRAVRFQDEKSSGKFLAGYYAEANLEWWLTENTGFYAGMTLASFSGNYQQQLGSRTAQIKLSSSSGFQFGISTRF